MRLTGVYPPIVTPFATQGQLDVGALVANIYRWDTTDLAGYVVAGSNGESVLLEPGEVETAVRIVRDTAAAGKLVIAGTGRESTTATIALTQHAADAGADAALVMTPSFFSGQMTGAALRQHYEAVADASPIPIILYNVPKFTHMNLSPEVAANLALHERIVGMKDSAGDIGQIGELVRRCPPGFQILIGNAPAFVSGLQAGASGGVLALANVAPEGCVAMWHLVTEGRYAEAWGIYHRLMPVARAVTSGYGVPGLKAAMDLLGYCGGNPRSPLLALSAPEREALRQVLADAGLLSQ